MLSLRSNPRNERTVTQPRKMLSRGENLLDLGFFYHSLSLGRPLYQASVLPLLVKTLINMA